MTICEFCLHDKNTTIYHINNKNLCDNCTLHFKVKAIIKIQKIIRQYLYKKHNPEYIKSDTCNCIINQDLIRVWNYPNEDGVGHEIGKLPPSLCPKCLNSMSYDEWKKRSTWVTAENKIPVPINRKKQIYEVKHDKMIDTTGMTIKQLEDLNHLRMYMGQPLGNRKKLKENKPKWLQSLKTLERQLQPWEYRYMTE